MKAMLSYVSYGGLETKTVKGGTLRKIKNKIRRIVRHVCARKKLCGNVWIGNQPVQSLKGFLKD